MANVAARRGGTLRLRILSALILLPATLAAVWFGSPWIVLAVALAGYAMGWECGRLTGGGPFGARYLVIAAAITAAIAAIAAGWFSVALAAAVLGAVGAALVSRAEAGWAAGGTLWIVGGCVAFLWLDTEPAGGRGTIFWLLAVVWATDIFAYFAGKTIGGPRLAPRLSPNKTWAGLAGGLVGSALAGLAAAALARHATVAIVAVSLVLSLVAQAGDLAESGAKRHFSVKDTSGLIPGHGGMLDRLDGLLAASIALALLTLFSGGLALEFR